MAEGFLETLLGYHDVRANGGSKLPRRNILNFLNGRVLDVGGETQIVTTDNPLWSETELLAAQADNYAPPDIENLTDIAVAGGQAISGVSAAGLNILKKRLWNLDDGATMSVLHDDPASLASNRILTPTGGLVIIVSNDAATIVRNAANTRWLLLPCLA